MGGARAKIENIVQKRGKDQEREEKSYIDIKR